MSFADFPRSTYAGGTAISPEREKIYNFKKWLNADKGLEIHLFDPNWPSCALVHYQSKSFNYDHSLTVKSVIYSHVMGICFLQFLTIYHFLDLIKLKMYYFGCNGEKNKGK